jgi:tetratricopeptide (TPR) repeat protein
MIDLAMELMRRGNLSEAEVLCKQRLRAQPQDADALHVLGLIAFQTARLDESLAHLRRAIELRPEMAEAHNSLANVLRSRGMMEEAIAAYTRAVELNPNFLEAHYNLGTSQRERGRVAEAIKSFRRVLELKPDFADAANDLGSALREAGHFEEAARILQRTVQNSPRFYQAQNNLGNVLRALGRFDEAESALRAALQIKPDIAQVHVNLGNVLRDKGDLPGAIAATRHALTLRPDLPDLHQTLGSLLLLAGQYAEGWPEYEWRWRCRNMIQLRSTPGRPRWDGSNLDGRTILLQSDAGLGDAIQCTRYIPLIADRGGQVVLECQRELHPLFANLKGVVQLITADDPLPPHDVHCPLMSLPLAFGTTLETIPIQIPYVAADEALIHQWRQRLSNSPRPRVGLAWAGNPTHTHDRRRSIPLEMLAPFATAIHAPFHSLQTRNTATHALTPPQGLNLVDYSRDLTNFAQTAALIMNLDLVISVDTSVAHLAGALGKPVWVLLPFAPDWRWMLHRQDSPWYPTARLFRQTRFGDWADVISRVREELLNFS